MSRTLSITSGGGLKQDLSNISQLGKEQIISTVYDDLLDSSGIHIKSEFISSIPILDVITVTTIGERDALVGGVKEGDFCIVTSIGRQYIYNGTGWIELNGSTSISGLVDTDISAPISGEFLKYDGVLNKWVNRPLQTNDLADVDIQLAQNGDILRYSSGDAKWLNQNLNMQALEDFVITGSLAANDLMRYTSAGTWSNIPSSNFTKSSDFNTHKNDASIHRALPDPSSANGTLTASSGSYSITTPNLSALGDVSLSLPLYNNQTLTHNGVVWVNKSVEPNKYFSIENISRPLVLDDREKVLANMTTSSMIQFTIPQGVYVAGDLLTFLVLNRSASIRLSSSVGTLIDRTYRASVTIKSYCQLLCVDVDSFRIITREPLHLAQYAISNLGVQSYRINSNQPCKAYMNSRGLYLSFNDMTNLRHLMINKDTGSIISNVVTSGWTRSSNILEVGDYMFVLEIQENIGGRDVRLLRSNNDFATANSVYIGTVLLTGDSLLYDSGYDTIIGPYIGTDHNAAYWVVTKETLVPFYFGIGELANISGGTYIDSGYHRGGSVMITIDGSGVLKYAFCMTWAQGSYGYGYMTSNPSRQVHSLTGFNTAVVKCHQSSHHDPYVLAAYQSGVSLWSFTSTGENFVKIRTIPLSVFYMGIQCSIINDTVYILTNTTTVPSCYTCNIARYNIANDEYKLMENPSNEISANSSDLPVYVLVNRPAQPPIIVKVNSGGISGPWSLITGLNFD